MDPFGQLDECEQNIEFTLTPEVVHSQLRKYRSPSSTSEIGSLITPLGPSSLPSMNTINRKSKASSQDQDQTLNKSMLNVLCIEKTCAIRNGHLTKINLSHQ